MLQPGPPESTYAPLHLESPIADARVRAQALASLVAQVAARAGAFAAEHAPLSEEFLGIRLRVGAESLALSHRLDPASAVVALHRGPEGTRRYCLGPGAWLALRSRVEATADVLHGHEVEVDQTLLARSALHADGTVVYSDRWWDHWQDAPHGPEGSLGQRYRDVLHPLVAALVHERLAVHLGEQPQVMDLGGGDGALLQALGLGGHLVERNERQRKAAQDRFGRTYEVHAGDLRQLTDLGAVGDGPVDLALAVGSLHLHAMAPVAAWQVVHSLFADMAPGGFLVMAGHTPCLLNQDDLELIGFQVLNTTVPGRGTDGGRQQLYLARRPR